MTSVGRGNSAQPASAEREFVFTPDDFRVPKSSFAIEITSSSLLLYIIKNNK